jgi:hypothetical protein
MLSNTYNIAMERDSCRIKFGRVIIISSLDPQFFYDFYAKKV